MKRLRDILYRVSIKKVLGSTKKQIKHIFFDSRKVKIDGVFVAIRGTQVDGHKFIDIAVEKGATVIVCETIPEQAQEGITYIQVDDSGYALGIMASNFYGNPSEKIKLVGVTGTNGKTTIVTLLYNMYKLLAYDVGLISTIHYRINEYTYPSTHTTPNPLVLNHLLADMVEEGCTHCFMEVSSHAVTQGRIAGLKFAGGIFTNLTHDHVDYHGSFQAYSKAKKGFFDSLPTSAFALVNLDDKQGKVMLQNTKAEQWNYGIKLMADIRGRIIENSFEGLYLKINKKRIHSLMVGEFNAYNLLAVYGAAILLGEDEMDVLKALSCLKTAEGRFDCVYGEAKKVVGIVDYSHTPDALMKVLKTIHAVRRKDKEKVICIVGCGGDRDKGKRPLMARVACELSHKIILTSDNPRTEDPETIIKHMEDGVAEVHATKVMSITARIDAIKTACDMAQAGDIILLAGKGHEKYQEVNGVRYPFDDKEELRKALDLVGK